MDRPIIAIIQPSYYGLGYLDAAKAMGYEVVAIVQSINDPKKFSYEGKYCDLIVAEVVAM